MSDRAPRLTLDEALAMLDSMAAQADRDSDEADKEPDAIMGHFWCGWAEGLRTLRQHIETGVKATCFPMGSCTCHPVKVPSA